jgi:hypothetical protein
LAWLSWAWQSGGGPFRLDYYLFCYSMVVGIMSTQGPFMVALGGRNEIIFAMVGESRRFWMFKPGGIYSIISGVLLLYRYTCMSKSQRPSSEVT